jgi:tetratricopeptide (TPR) repeat protein
MNRIPIARIIEKLDAAFDDRDLRSAGQLLTYWRGEAVALGDREGELAMVSEQLGYYRKTGEREAALEAVDRAEVLIDALQNKDTVSGATVALNAATTLKAFGEAERSLYFYEIAKDVYLNRLSDDDPRKAGFYNNYALAFVDLGCYPEAETAYRTAIAILEAGGGEQAEIAVTYVNLAYLYAAWGGTDADVTPCLDKAFAQLTAIGIPQDGNTAFHISKCADAFAEFRDPRADDLRAAAETYYHRPR